uniref:Uncharacterized protein n=1 Tax=Rhizophora mucronata TaxID=61149 RepID=A0A2P2MYK2_RHIMU
MYFCKKCQSYEKESDEVGTIKYNILPHKNCALYRFVCSDGQSSKANAS